MVIELYDGFNLTNPKDLFLKKEDGWTREMAQVVDDVSTESFTSGWDEAFSTMADGLDALRETH
jgi:hypothetical protein